MFWEVEAQPIQYFCQSNACASCYSSHGSLNIVSLKAQAAELLLCCLHCHRAAIHQHRLSHASGNTQALNSGLQHSSLVLAHDYLQREWYSESGAYAPQTDKEDTCTHFLTEGFSGATAFIRPEQASCGAELPFVPSPSLPFAPELPPAALHAVAAA